MGIAVLDTHGPLIYHGVCSFVQTDMPLERLKAIRAVVVRLLDDYRPKVLVVEKTFIGGNRNTALLNVVADEIVALGQLKRIKVIQLAANTVKKALCGSGAATKAQVAQAVIRYYPQLRVYLQQNRRWKERFHANMFDAVALGLALNS